MFKANRNSRLPAGDFQLFGYRCHLYGSNLTVSNLRVAAGESIKRMPEERSPFVMRGSVHNQSNSMI